MIEIIKDTKIDFMKARYVAFTISGILSLIGIFTLVQIGLGKANMGIDFAGGTAVQVKFDKKVPLQDIRSAMEDSGLKGVEIQDLPSEGKVMISLKKQEETLGTDADKIVSTLNERFSELHPVVDSTTEIGPKVGTKLRDDAIKAVLASTVFILLYVAFRFKLQFGIGALVATFHDVLAVLGIFYLMGKEINLILVSALLMIAGYSLTDTVVVFDRIRENMRARYKGKIADVINLSINEVLSRTIIVSLTTLFTAVALFAYGGEVIHDFSLAIILGILVGTYSSIFVASPVIAAWGGKGGLGGK